MSFNIGEKVFGKLRGYPPWPAKICEVENDEYLVKFYPKGDKATMKAKEIYHYYTYIPKIKKLKKSKSLESALIAFFYDMSDDELNKVISIDCSKTFSNYYAHLISETSPSESISAVEKDSPEKTDTNPPNAVEKDSPEKTDANPPNAVEKDSPEKTDSNPPNAVEKDCSLKTDTNPPNGAERECSRIADTNPPNTNTNEQENVKTHLNRNDTSDPLPSSSNNDSTVSTRNDDKNKPVPENIAEACAELGALSYYLRTALLENQIPNVQRCLSALEILKHMNLTVPMLFAFPVIVEDVVRIRKYHMNLEGYPEHMKKDLKKKAKAIRTKAAEVIARFHQMHWEEEGRQLDVSQNQHELSR